MSPKQAVAEAPARLDERQPIVAFIRKRRASVDHFVQRGRLTAAKCGHPKHPLMLAYSEPLLPWSAP